MSQNHADEAGGFDEIAGWAALPGFLSETETQAVIAACDELRQLPAEKRRARDKTAAGTHHLCELDDRSDIIDAILDRESLVSVVTEILGPVFRRDQIEYRSPQPSFGGQLLHADGPPKTDTESANVATAIVALVDFTSTNGATRLVPGSHRRPDLQRLSGSLADHPDQITLIGPLGTAFVFSGHVLHSGTPNRSNQQRPALHCVWRR